jgi:hypothetical protein
MLLLAKNWQGLESLIPYAAPWIKLILYETKHALSMYFSSTCSISTTETDY